MLLVFSIVENTGKRPYCIVPWGAISILSNGNVLPCVASNHHLDSVNLGNIKTQTFKEIWMGSKAVALRKAHQQLPLKFAGCLLCETVDVQGGKSRRVEMNEKYGDYFASLNVDLNNISDPQEIIFLDMALSSLCNLTCTMCSSSYSTGWIDFDKTLAAEGFNNDPKPTSTTGYENLRNNLESLFPYLNNLNYLFLKGGEPLLNKDVIWFLEQLAEKGISKKVTLAIITNGTVYNKKISDLFDSFKKVEYVVSLDATDDLYQYIRGGGKFHSDGVIDNIKKIKQNNQTVWITTSPTIQAYNVLRFSDLVRVSFEISDEVYVKNWVMLPTYQSVVSLPSELYPLAIAEMEKCIAFFNEKQPNNKSIPFFKYMISYLNKDIPWISAHMLRQNHTVRFKQFTKIVDKERSMNLGAILPELAPFLNAP